MGILAPAGLCLVVNAHRLLVPDVPAFIWVFHLSCHPHCSTGTFIVCPTSNALTMTDFDFSRRTIQFVGISAFHTRISDPLIGGTYMTVWDPQGSPLVNRYTHAHLAAQHIY